MNFTLDPKIRVDIQERCLNWLDLNKTYDIVIVKPNKEGTRNVLKLYMFTEPNTKYVIHYNFDLDGQVILMPKDCILEIDGGDLSNGTLVGNNTILLNTNKVDILQDCILEGTWKDENSLVDGEDIDYSDNFKLKFSDKEYDRSNFSGYGRIYLRKNIQKVLNVENRWFYHKGYDNLNYIFCTINNKIYHPHSNGVGLILNGNQVIPTANYDSQCLPEVAQNGNLLQIAFNDYNMSSFKVILPLGTVFDSLSIQSDGNLTYITGQNLSLATFYPFNDSYLTSEYRNILTQEMFPLSNTRYIILYDYDLNGEELVLPDNCILDFLGGSIKNGKISGKGIKVFNPCKTEFSNFTINSITVVEGSLELETPIFDYDHVVMSEEDWENFEDKKASTIYLIVEE